MPSPGVEQALGRGGAGGLLVDSAHSLQGCGTDDVHYVLPAGHLCPPAHLHCLLGHDCPVSFAHTASPPGVRGAEGNKGRTCPLSTFVLGRHPSLWARTVARDSGKSEPRQKSGLGPGSIRYQHLGRPCGGATETPCGHAFLDFPLGTWPPQDNLSTSSGHPTPASPAVRPCQ